MAAGLYPASSCLPAVVSLDCAPLPQDLTGIASMKAGTHPKYTEITVTCSCGNKFQTRSTLGANLDIEVCSNCHPFYTGKQKMLDSGGRVDRFRKKYGLK